MTKNKKNRPMYAACILLCLVLITAHMTSGLYSRYTAGGSGSDSARVISFGNLTLTESGDFLADDQGSSTNTLRVTPGVNLAKQATVNFEGSEAAAYVFLTVTVNSGWTTTEDSYYKGFSLGSGAMTWSVASDWTYVAQVTNADSITYAYCIVLEPNKTLQKTVITDGEIQVSSSITESQLGGMTIPDITFQATAVQSNGFSSAEAAWNSIKNK